MRRAPSRPLPTQPAGHQCIRLVLLSLLALVALAPASLIAETIIVDAFTDGSGAIVKCELRDAIEAANDDVAVDGCVAGNGDDRIEFAITGGILIESDLPAVSENLHIVGPGRDLLIIDGDDQNRQFDVLGTVDTFTLTGLTVFQGFAASFGGCLSNLAADLLIEDVEFQGCTADFSGGALYQDQGDAVIRRALFQGNRSAEDGGAIALSTGPFDTVVIEDSTFLGNRSTASTAGALSIGASTQATVRRSTFAGNLSVDDGGAIRIFSSSASLTLEHCTVADNEDGSSGLGEGGGLALEAGTTTLFNTIVAANRDLAGGGTPDIFVGASATVTSLGNNLIGANGSGNSTTAFPAGTTNANGDFVGTNIAPIDALLGAPQDNGGPVTTVMPQAGSPAIDQGSCPGEVADQRGYGNVSTGSRVIDDGAIANDDDGCDIGAVEVGAVDLPFFEDGFESGDTDGWSSSTG